MRKDLKTRTPVNCAVDNELNEKLIELSKETMIPKSKLLDVAIKLLLKKYKKWINILVISEFYEPGWKFSSVFIF